MVDANNVGKTISGEEEEEDDVPEQIEEIIEILLNGLRDKVCLLMNAKYKMQIRLFMRIRPIFGKFVAYHPIFFY